MVETVSVTTVVPIILAVISMAVQVAQLVRVGVVVHPTIPDGVRKITPGEEVTAVFTGEVVPALVMAVVNMEVKLAGDGAVPLIRESEVVRRKSLLMSKEKEYKAEILRLLEIFEAQYPESPGYLYDELPYMVALGAIVIHRAGCELNDEPEKYKPYEQLDTLELTTAMREEIENFLIRNQLDKAETYYIFDSH